MTIYTIFTVKTYVLHMLCNNNKSSDIMQCVWGVKAGFVALVRAGGLFLVCFKLCVCVCVCVCTGLYIMVGT